MCHLQTSPLKPTLDVEPLIRLTAIQNRLVAPDFLGHKVQCLDNPKTKFLTLLILCNSNVLDVPNKAQLVDELALDD